MIVKFWPLHMLSLFFTCRSLRKGSLGSENTRMDYECLKTHYDVCGGGVWLIFSHHCGSSRINCWLHNYLPVVTSSSRKVVSCVSSNPDVIITGIIGFYGLTVIVDLLSLPLIKNFKIMSQFFRDWKFELETVWLLVHLQIGGDLWEKVIFSVFKIPCYETQISSFLAAPTYCLTFFLSDGGRKRRGRRIRKCWSCSLTESLKGASH